MSDEERSSMDFMDDFDVSCTQDILADMSNLDEVPTALIVANIQQSVFEDAGAQIEFEHVFKQLDNEVSFIYLKNFRRARIQFSSPDLAGIARIRCDGLCICGQNIKCFFSQVQSINKDNSLLRPPKPQRMFLISPPASPPVGWEPAPESEPVINYDLLNALAKLSPGDAHEIHPRSMSAPAIVVHICEDPDGYRPGMNPTIVQTRRPEGNPC